MKIFRQLCQLKVKIRFYKSIMNNPLFSIIIPCYNQGEYLKDTLASLNGCDSSLFEVIIINDGSSDAYTNSYINSLKNGFYHIIEQGNAGLANARNAGIMVSKGEFILPLDSDNKIRPEFLTKSLTVFREDPNVAVFYGNAEYFGEREGFWIPGDFNLQKLLISNYIDACAVIRKSVLDKVGFYDTEMKYMGWEDWEMWLRISSYGYKFHYENEVVFDYRVLSNSMSKQVYNAYEKPNFLENYVNRKYPNFIGHDHIYDFVVRRFKASPVLFILKLVLRSYFYSYYQKLLTKNKIRNGI